MKVSVIIPTLNEEHHVGFLLADLHCQSRRPEEIIVVDGGSQDGTRLVVGSFEGVEILPSPPGVAIQRNLGTCEATGEVLAFFDADVRLTGRYLEDLLADFRRRNLSVACPLYMPHHSTLAVNVILWRLIRYSCFCKRYSLLDPGSVSSSSAELFKAAETLIQA